MEERSLNFTIEDLQQQIAEMNRLAAEEPSQLADVLAVSLQELLDTHEELRITQEQLQQQREELFAACQSLEAERHRYRGLFESIPYGCLVTDAAGSIREANQSASALLCVDRDHLIGKSMVTFIAAKSRQALNSQILKLVGEGCQEGCQVQDWKIHLKPLGRPTLPATVTVAALASSPQAEHGLLYWLIRDIPESRRADTALRASENLYHLFFEEDLTGEFISTSDGQILACNPAFARILGFASVKEAMDCNLNLLYRDHRVREAYLELLQKEKKIEYHETELCRCDGQPVQLIEKALGTFDAQGRLIEIKGYLFDITERKGLEEQLRQSQKMEAIRRLSNRIAHDFNNLLVGIKGYSDLLLYHLDSHAPLRKDIEEIKKAGERATSLTQQLMTFSRKQVYQPQMVELNAVMSDMNIQGLIGEDIILTLACGAALGLVKADPGQIERIIANLVANACEAMPQGGKLIIKIANIHLDESYARQQVGVQAGPYVMLSVTDSGTGMDEETQSHLFEPFFTTKSQGKERGLSLSTVYGIVQQSGGHITVSSRLGQGTTFKIYFPRIMNREPRQESFRPRAGSGRLIHRRQKGSETILLVEDDESVRTAICLILKNFGYTVLEAHQAEEAIMICKQRQGAIHLMLTDMVMPHMNGLDLAHHLNSLRPEMKVIFMSGNLNIIADQSHSPELEINLLPKPFVLDDLVFRVREVLDGGGGKEQGPEGNGGR